MIFIPLLATLPGNSSAVSSTNGRFKIVKSGGRAHFALWPNVTQTSKYTASQLIRISPTIHDKVQQSNPSSKLAIECINSLNIKDENLCDSPFYFKCIVSITCVPLYRQKECLTKRRERSNDPWTQQIHPICMRHNIYSPFVWVKTNLATRQFFTWQHE